MDYSCAFLRPFIPGLSLNECAVGSASAPVFPLAVARERRTFSRMMKTLLSSTILASILVLAGCGGGETKSAPAATEPAATPATTPPADPAGVKVIRLTGDDTMRFNITTIEAAPGEAIRVELRNIGRMPKQSMAHNFVLFQPMADAELNALGIAASMAPPLYLPKDMSKVLAHSTKILGPGESETIDFTAPTEPGEYPYLCTFPGHFATMRGKLIVK
jgi:azurin